MWAQLYTYILPLLLNGSKSTLNMMVLCLRCSRITAFIDQNYFECGISKGSCYVKAGNVRIEFRCTMSRYIPISMWHQRFYDCFSFVYTKRVYGSFDIFNDIINRLEQATNWMGYFISLVTNIFQHFWVNINSLDITIITAQVVGKFRMQGILTSTKLERSVSDRNTVASVGITVMC